MTKAEWRDEQEVGWSEKGVGLGSRVVGDAVITSSCLQEEAEKDRLW